MSSSLRFYFWPTPNARKVAIFLEEAELDYEVIPVDIARGAQLEADFESINPNRKIPALIDLDIGPEPLAIFESGAILMHLAEKTSRFWPSEPAARSATTQWLFWQMAGLGPMAGQLSHFVNYAPPGQDYGRERYAREYRRLLEVLDRRLASHEFLAGTYSIADMACFPWVLPYRALSASLDGLPALRRWFDAIKTRPAVRRAVDLGADWVERRPKLDAAARKVLFEGHKP